MEVFPPLIRPSFIKAKGEQICFISIAACLSVIAPSSNTCQAKSIANHAAVAKGFNPFCVAKPMVFAVNAFLGAPLVTQRNGYPLVN